MDLTDRQRKLLFAGLVVVLAAVGVFLTVANTGKKNASAIHQSSPPAAPTLTTAPATSAPPPTTGPPPETKSFDIYRLLPYSQKEFATAADVARRFTVAYGTYRFDEDPKAYMARLQGLVTGDLATKLAQDSTTPGVLEQRNRDQETSTSDATLDSIRDIGKDQIIFLVTGRQHITKGGSTSDQSEQYAVTVTRSGGGWAVYAFLPANVGDN